MKKIAITVLAVIFSIAVLGFVSNASNKMIDAIASQDIQTVAVDQLDDNSNAYTNVVATTISWDVIKTAINVVTVLGVFGIGGFGIYRVNKFYKGI